MPTLDALDGLLTVTINLSICQRLSMACHYSTSCQLVWSQVRSGRGISSCKSILLLHLAMLLSYYNLRASVSPFNIATLDATGASFMIKLLPAGKIRQETKHMPFENNVSSNHHPLSKRCTKHKQKKNHLSYNQLLH